MHMPQTKLSPFALPTCSFEARTDTPELKDAFAYHSTDAGMQETEESKIAGSRIKQEVFVNSSMMKNATERASEKVGELKKTVSRFPMMLGRYSLLSKIGSGGMGTVYKAEHCKLKRIVALKLLKTNSSNREKRIRRFLREAEIVMNLDHPNLVRGLDFDTDGKFYYFVTEYLQGKSLWDFIDTFGGLPVTTAVNYMIQITDALDYIHQRGFIHRDLKPNNMMIVKNDRVKVLDFGIGRKLESDPTSAITGINEVVGTVDFLAPEQVIGPDLVDQRTDIYNLGCTFYCMLTGHPPFQVRDFSKKVWHHLNTPAPSILKERSQLPLVLDEICRKMMAKKQDERFQSMRELNEILQVVYRHLN